MQAYSLDLRQRIAQACAEPGARQGQVAVRFSVSVAFVGKLLRRQRQTGQLAALPGRDSRSSFAINNVAPATRAAAIAASSWGR